MTAFARICGLNWDHDHLTQDTKTGMIKTIKLKVDDIVCTGCAEDMETVLLNQDGILEADVSFADDLIEIQYDASMIERAAVIKAAMGIANISEVISEQ